MKKTFIILLFLQPVFIFSQNYQTVSTNVTRYYQPENKISNPIYGDEKFLRVLDLAPDPLGVPGELINPPEYHTEEYSIYPDPYECIYPEMASWIGWKIIINPNGENYFFNRDYDTIFIDADAKLNESWIFFHSNQYEYYRAEVVEHDTMSFLGVTDSVKRIEINLISDKRSDTLYEIAISKNHGFIKVLNFRDFPGFDISSLQPMEHTLIASSILNSSKVLLTYGDVHDYDEGDIIHKSSYYEDPWVYIWTNVISKYIGRVQYGDDSVKYTIAREVWGADPPDFEVYHYWDTINKKYYHLSDTIRKGLPFTSFVQNDQIKLRDFAWYNKLNMYQRPVLKTKEPPFYYDDPCFYLPGEIPPKTRYSYFKGCGSTSFYQDILNQTSSGTSLRYYQKGDETWGTPLDPPVGINDATFNYYVKVWPNPVSEKLIIESRPYQLEQIIVYDLMGNKIRTYRPGGHKFNFDVSYLQGGIYFLRIIDSHKNLKTEKLIVSHY